MYICTYDLIYIVFNHHYDADRCRYFITLDNSEVIDFDDLPINFTHAGGIDDDDHDEDVDDGKVDDDDVKVDDDDRDEDDDDHDG